MMKHENSNIEIISPDLWAVRFSLIPMIPQINYEMKFDMPIRNLPGQLSSSGVMVLNKDFVFYPGMKKVFQHVMRMKNRALFRAVINMQKTKADATTKDGMILNLWKFALLIEVERRNRKKGG